MRLRTLVVAVVTATAATAMVTVGIVDGTSGATTTAAAATPNSGTPVCPNASDVWSWAPGAGGAGACVDPAKTAGATLQAGIVAGACPAGVYTVAPNDPTVAGTIDLASGFGFQPSGAASSSLQQCNPVSPDSASSTTSGATPSQDVSLQLTATSSSAKIFYGKTTTITWSVRNTGDETARDVAIDVDGGSLCYFPTLAAGATATCSTGHVAAASDGASLANPAVSVPGYAVAVDSDGNPATPATASVTFDEVPVPVIDIVAPDVTSYTAHPVHLSVRGTDSDGFTLTWTASGLPPGVSMAPGGIIRGTPRSTSSTMYTVGVTATDSARYRTTAFFTWVVSLNTLHPTGTLRIVRSQHDLLLTAVRPRVWRDEFRRVVRPALAYRWYVDGHAIRGATGARYRVPSRERNRRFVVRITASLRWFQTATVTSRAV